MRSPRFSPITRVHCSPTSWVIVAASPTPSFTSLCIVALWDPVARKPKYFLLRSLPFGARNAFFVFCQFGKAFEYLLVKLLWVTTAEYVDDYPELTTTLTVAPIAPN